MMKQLVRAGKAFPHCLFAAIGLLFCLTAHGALAAKKQSCDCPCAKDKKQTGAPESPTGQVTIVWPKQDNFLARTMHSKAEVLIDGNVAGTVDFDAPLTVSVPNGPHKLMLKGNDTFGLSKPNEVQITVSPQKPLYFQVVGSNLSELDSATAQSLTPNANTQTGSGPGTIYLYWPRTALDFGLLDKLNTDSPLLLDGKRIGAFANGDYVVVKAPAGEHVLALDMTLSNGRVLKQALILGAGSTRYFHIERRIDFDIVEDDEAADPAKKGLRQREVSAQ